MRSAAPVSTVLVASLLGGVGVIPSVQTISAAVLPAQFLPTPSANVRSRAEGAGIATPSPLTPIVDVF